jgi:hypothetical protein
VIQIDVHPTEENSINTSHAFHTQLRMVPDHTSHVVHVCNLSLVPTRSKQGPTPGRSLGDQRQTGPADSLGHLIPPPS